MNCPQLEAQNAYRNLSSKLKKKRIEQATQQPQYIKPNPQSGYRYPEQNFIDFRVGPKENIRLVNYRYVSNIEPVGLIFIFNGLYYHTNHSAHIAKVFADQGYAVVGFDYPGFGRSQGEKGQIDSFEHLAGNCRLFVKKVSEIYPKLPRFVIGASLGGLLAYHLSLKEPELFSGVCLVSAMIKPMVGSLLCTIAATISKLLPKAKCLAPIRGIATKNKTVSDQLQKDPDYYKGQVPANTYKILLNALNDCAKTFPSYLANVLIIQGGLDKVVDPSGAFDLYDKSKSKDKKLLFYENMWHDAFHQEQIHDMIPKMVDWVKEHTHTKI